jgi:hypothetical protein
MSRKNGRNHIEKMLEMLESENLSRVELQRAHRIVNNRMSRNLCSPEHVLGVEDAGEEREAKKADGRRSRKSKGGEKDKDGDVAGPAQKVRKEGEPQKEE